MLKAAARQRIADGQAELDLGLEVAAAAASGGPLEIVSSRMGHLWEALCRVRGRLDTSLSQHPQAVLLAGRLDDPRQHQLPKHLIPAGGLGEPERVVDQPGSVGRGRLVVADCDVVGSRNLRAIELAPGLDVEKDVLNQMDFRPAVSPRLAEMDPALFTPGPLGLADRTPLALVDRLTYDPDENILFCNFEGLVIEDADATATLATRRSRCEQLARWRSAEPGHVGRRTHLSGSTDRDGARGSGRSLRVDRGRGARTHREARRQAGG